MKAKLLVILFALHSCVFSLMAADKPNFEDCLSWFAGVRQNSGQCGIPVLFVAKYMFMAYTFPQ